MRRYRHLIIAAAVIVAAGVGFLLVPDPVGRALVVVALSVLVIVVYLHRRLTSELEQRLEALRDGQDNLLASLAEMMRGNTQAGAALGEELSVLGDRLTVISTELQALSKAHVAHQELTLDAVRRVRHGFKRADELDTRRRRELQATTQRGEEVLQTLQHKCELTLSALQAPSTEPGLVEETLRRLKHLANAVQRGKDEVLARVESASVSLSDRNQLAALATQLAAVQKRLDHPGCPVDLVPSLDELLRRVKLLAAAHERHRSELKVRLEGVAGEAFDVFRLGTILFDAHADLPPIGGWAITASTLSPVVAEILRNPQLCNIVECGSGASTVWFAAALKHRGTGHVYALEHDPQYLALTREYIHRNGLDAYVTLIHAPLSEQVVGGDAYRWYDLSAASLPGRVHLLFVDGPPAASGPKARYPAYALLRSKLANGAWVVLDDTVRIEEQEIGNDWLALSSDFVQLATLRVLPKSTVFHVSRNDKSGGA